MVPNDSKKNCSFNSKANKQTKKKGFVTSWFAPASCSPYPARSSWLCRSDWHVQTDVPLAQEGDALNLNPIYKALICLFSLTLLKKSHVLWFRGLKPSHLFFLKSFSFCWMVLMLNKLHLVSKAFWETLKKWTKKYQLRPNYWSNKSNSLLMCSGPCGLIKRQLLAQNTIKQKTN